MGKLYFKYGVMGACKSAEALMTKYRYSEIGKEYLFCKTRRDDRDGARVVKSRIGLEATNVPFLDEILSAGYDYTGIDCIIVDEIQFASKEEIDKLAFICDTFNIPIICYGLKTDFKGNLFEGSKRLFEIADKLEEIKQVCWCGKKALFNARVINGKMVTEGEQIVIGGDNKYVALCREHYVKGAITHKVFSDIKEDTELSAFCKKEAIYRLSECYKKDESFVKEHFNEVAEIIRNVIDNHSSLYDSIDIQIEKYLDTES